MVFFTAETSRMETVMSNKESGMYTFDENIVSDLHKDAYGFRPSTYWWQIWSESTDDQKQGTWDDLIDQLNQSMEQEKQAQARAIERFEVDIAKSIEWGARTRAAAIRWLVSAYDSSDYYTELDKAEYFCYHNNLPYSMANEIAECLKEAA
jgi:hypothetical protein